MKAETIAGILMLLIVVVIVLSIVIMYYTITLYNTYKSDQDDLNDRIDNIGKRVDDLVSNTTTIAASNERILYIIDPSLRCKQPQPAPQPRRIR